MKMRLLVLIGLLAVGFVIPVMAEEVQMATTEMADGSVAAVAVTEDVAVEAQPEKVNNKFCPTDGGDVNAMGGAFEVVHNGKAYNLCCAACEKEFMANLEKYTKIAEESEKIEMASQEDDVDAMVEDDAAMEGTVTTGKETHDAAY